MRWFNTNALHNSMNAAIAIVAGGALAGFDWTLFGVSNAAALKITGSLALGKIIINAVRDGPAGMVAPPPPSEEK